MAYNKDLPYNDLPLLPPSGNWESITLYKKLTEARAALSELKGRLPVIPNASMLINSLVLQEARDSSTIENIFTTNDKLYKAFSASNPNTDPATKEVLRYREALWKAFTGIHSHENFTIQLAIDIFRNLTLKDEEIRTIQVYIGNSAQVIYTPPEPGVIMEKLVNWFDFALTNKTYDPLIKMAILHYQFECIHPFTDGNGRTGRILNVLNLCFDKLLDLPVLYLSKFILDNKIIYYRLLREVTENNNWEEWICFMLDAIKETSVLTLNKVDAIFAKYTAVINKVKSEASDIYSRELIELIFSQPYCKIAFLENQNIASRNTASKYLKKLEELGILVSEVVGREILYKNVELISILSSS